MSEVVVWNTRGKYLAAIGDVSEKGNCRVLLRCKVVKEINNGNHVMVL